MAKHLFLDLRGCRKGALSNAQDLQASLREILGENSFMVDRFHQFSPGGVSGVIRTADCCLSIHTWPEYNYAAVDILFYENEEKAGLIAQQIIKSLGASQPILRSLDRKFDEL